MANGKRGGARAGAGRKPRVPGKMERKILEEAIKSAISADRLDRLQAACARGEYLALLEINRLFDRVEQRLLRERAFAQGSAGAAVAESHVSRRQLLAGA